jgi:hypothetical protein
MIYTADYLISRRKAKWNEDFNIERDKIFRITVAQEIVQNKNLLNELKNNPEKLIELVFIIVDKDKNTVPFFLNEVQQDFFEKVNKAKKDYEKGILTSISFLILKGRQQGFTTAITAYQLSCTILNKNFEGYTIADSSSNAESIFENKAKYMYSNLPNCLKPTEKYNNKRQLRFEKINSTWSIDSAAKEMGRSRTINFLHASECAFWSFGIAITQASLGEALTKNSIRIYESTANGFNDYKTMWDSETHINCFYEWWKTKEYSLNFESQEIQDKFIQDINNSNDWIYKRLYWLKNEKQLSNEQLYWYYKKYQGYIDKETIKQEYPCTPEEAFISSGQCIFDTEILIQRLEILKKEKPLKVGYFIYDEQSTISGKMKDIKWVNDKKGYIRIYETPNLKKYCIGGDTAGDGSDSFIGQVLDAKSGNIVATLAHQMDSDLYAKQMYCLGKYYKNALIGIETNFDSYPQKELERLGYKNFYVREREDKITGRIEMKYGFQTNKITRPIIINELVRIAREQPETLNDEETINEMLVFVKNESGRPEAQVGFHDDRVMALAIAHHIRSQIVFDKEPIVPETNFTFNVEKPPIGDYGETIEII